MAQLFNYTPVGLPKIDPFFFGNLPALLYDFLVQFVISWISNVLLLYRCIHAHYCSCPVIRWFIHPDAFLQDQLNPCFSYPLPESYQFCWDTRNGRPEMMFSAEILVVIVFRPLFYQAFIA